MLPAGNVSHSGTHWGRRFVEDGVLLRSPVSHKIWKDTVFYTFEFSGSFFYKCNDSDEQCKHHQQGARGKGDTALGGNWSIAFVIFLYFLIIYSCMFLVPPGWWQR